MTSDPFDALGLPPRFDLDPAEIERAYLERTLDSHPDRSASDDAEARSAVLNEARESLLRSESRAVALLNRYANGAPAPAATLPDGFLMEILETRERVESAINAGDPAEIERWSQWAFEQRREHEARVAPLLREMADTSATRAADRVRETLSTWRYIERLIDALEDAVP